MGCSSARRLELIGLAEFIWESVDKELIIDVCLCLLPLPLVVCTVSTTSFSGVSSEGLSITETG